MSDIIPFGFGFLTGFLSMLVITVVVVRAINQSGPRL